MLLVYNCDVEERRGQVWGQRGTWKIIAADASEINEHLFLGSQIYTEPLKHI